MRNLPTTGPSIARSCCRRRNGLALALASLLAAFPAQAQSGEIIIIRQVDPRNAIVPGTSKNTLTVKTAPDSAYFNLISETVRQLSDADAATVSSGLPASASVEGAIRLALDGTFGSPSSSGGVGSDHSSSMSGGGVVGNAIGLGMSSFQNALGTVRTSVAGGK